MKSGIYLITCGINGKVYVGSSINIKRRWTRHKNHLVRNQHSNKHLQSAYNLYGKDAFAYSILEHTEPENLLERELHWVQTKQSNNNKFGFNIDLPGTTKYKTEKVDPTIRNERKYPSYNKVIRDVVCIDTATGSVLEFTTTKEVFDKFNIDSRKLHKGIIYWKTKGVMGTRSIKGHLMMYKEDYDPSFDYLNYRMFGKQNIKGSNLTNSGTIKNSKKVQITFPDSSTKVFDTIGRAAQHIKTSRQVLSKYMKSGVYKEYKLSFIK